MLFRATHQGRCYCVGFIAPSFLQTALLKVIGSTCFVKGYPELQSKAKLTERYGATGRKLNAQELEKLINNTEQLVAQLTQEYEEHIKAEELRLYLESSACTQSIRKTIGPSHCLRAAAVQI